MTVKIIAEEIVESVVVRLTEERKKRGISHDRLAELAGLNRSTISLIEARKREATLLTMARIALAMKCSLGELILMAERTGAAEED